MRASNLSTVTTELIESYGNTAKNVIHAYRTGNERVARFVERRWESAIRQSASRLRADVHENALNAQKTISGIYVKGVVRTSDGADLVVDKFVEYAGKGVQQVSTNVDQFEKRTGVTALNRLAKAAVPAVTVVGDLAGKLEQGSSRLANTVAGQKAIVKVAAVKRAASPKKAGAAALRKPKVAKAATAGKGAKKASTGASSAAKKAAKPVARKTAARKSVAPVDTSAAV
jgi:hypothetical protein